MKKYDRVKDVLSSDFNADFVVLSGWVKTARHSKNLSFIELSDGSCFSGVQVIVEPTLVNYDEIIKVMTGYALIIKGQRVESPGKGQKYEIHAESVEIVGAVTQDYPLQKKQHSFEFLREIAHLRMRTNTFAAVMRIRHVAAMAIHEFFHQHHFCYIQSPIISTSDCEGAGEMFTVTHFDLNQLPQNQNGTTDFTQDFFAKHAFLTVSGQLEGEIAAHALKNVYTFGPTFRAENSNTSRHLAEFWMVEPEMAFCDLLGNIEVAEMFLKFVVQKVLQELPDDIDFFNSRIDDSLLKALQNTVAEPFAQIDYDEAIQLLEKSSQKFEYPVKWGIDLQSEHERYLVEHHFAKPLVITNYPKDIKAFYMYANDDGRTVRAMDLLVPRIGELIGGSQREDRYDVLKKRLEDLQLPLQDYWWYLDLRRYGGVPHSGFGLGFERLILFLTGMKNIRDVMPFPRTPGNADF